MTNTRQVRFSLPRLLLAACVATACGAQGLPIHGDVRSTSGVPVAGAVVTLTAADGSVVRSNTDGSGAFSFAATTVHGAYTLAAATASMQSSPIALDGDAPGQAPIHLLLHGKVAGGTHTPADAMEFSDTPTFTVAGVTDWTAVGGHGSDATLRTSEDLTRQTVGLNATPAATTPFDQAAADRLQAAVAKDAGSYDANHALGVLYLRAGRFAQAVPPLERAAAVHGGAALDEYALAQACAGVGDTAQARRHVQLALAKQQAGPYLLLAGELDERTGDALGAAQQMQRAVAVEPTEANYLAWGSELLLHRAIQQAAQVFARGVAQFPQSPRLHMGLGSALFAGAHYGDAAVQLCRASDLDPAAREPYLLLGKAAIAAPEPLPCAAPTLARFLQQQPQDAQAYFMNGMLLLRQGGSADRAGAEALFQKAVALDPRDAEAWLQLGILASAKHQDAEAVVHYRQAIAADSQLAEAHYRLGVALDRAGQHDEAQREFQQHAALLKAQADAVERQRREVKQFVVAMPPVSSSVAAP